MDDRQQTEMAPPQAGFRKAQLASACLPVGRDIFEQPEKLGFSVTC